uniref:AAA_12 domain-containing protein n=1 Tax=Caenorhabditis tropicalis TaxID=1561998 RepID=A0A1I7U674_9PELO
METDPPGPDPPAALLLLEESSAELKEQHHQWDEESLLLSPTEASSAPEQGGEAVQPGCRASPLRRKETPSIEDAATDTTTNTKEDPLSDAASSAAWAAEGEAVLPGCQALPAILATLFAAEEDAVPIGRYENWDLGSLSEVEQEDDDDDEPDNTAEGKEQHERPKRRHGSSADTDPDFRARDAKVRSEVHIPDRKLPPHMVVMDAHPWADHYKGAPSKATTGIKELAHEFELSEIQKFRNDSIAAAKKSSKPRSKPQRQPAEKMEFFEAKEHRPEGVIYIIKWHNGEQMRALPHHAEVVAHDRPDLFLVELSSHSKDTRNSEHIDVNDYLIGDAIIVHEVEAIPGKTVKDIKTDFKELHSYEKTCFWGVVSFTTLERTTRSSIISRIKGDSRQHVFCVASGVHVHAEAHKALFRRAAVSYEVGSKAQASVFCPQLEPAQLLSTIVKGESTARVVAMALPQTFEYVLQPTVLDIIPLDPSRAMLFANFAELFKLCQTNKSRGYRMLYTAGALGIAGVSASANSLKDIRQYATTIKAVTKISRKFSVTFNITTASGPPPSKKWTRGTKFSLRAASDDDIEFEVERSEVRNPSLVITAKPVSHNPSIIEAVGKLANAYVTVRQRLEDCGGGMGLFPKPEALDGLDPLAPVKQLLEATLGGPPIPTREIPDRDLSVELPDRPLSEQQRRYVNALPRTDTPVLAANSPFGVGKTTMTAVALINLVEANIKSEDVHIGLATTNAAVAALANSFVRCSKETRTGTQAVRVITQSNYDSLDTSLQTPIDYPVVWRQYLLDHVRDADIKATQGNSPSLLAKQAYVLLVKKGGVEELKLRSKAFNKISLPETPDLWTVFLAVARPRILFGTGSSLKVQLNRPGAADLKYRVATIQIDEASQFSLAALLTIAPICPKARYALIGDVKQLPPYAENDLQRDLKEYAVGTVLKSTKGQVQTVDITTVYRCPYELTKMCSHLYYGSKLTPARKAREPNPAASDLHLNTEHPIQVVTYQGAHTTVGTSLFNSEEARLVRSLVEKLREQGNEQSVGILSFYKAQTAHLTSFTELSDLFVGTIDSAQGQEFDVTFILTSRSSAFLSNTDSSYSNGTESFIGDPHRINVALTRAKKLAVILLHEEAYKTSKSWTSVVNRIGANQRTTADIWKGNPPQAQPSLPQASIAPPVERLNAVSSKAAKKKASGKKGRR